MKKLTSLIFAFCLNWSAWAYDFNSGRLYYTITNSSTPYSVEVTDCSSSASTITIPETVTYNGNTYNVIGIGKDAFSGCTYLTSVTIPNSIITIGNYAFYDCSSLTSITIPNSVVTIGSNAFYDCSSLTSITIPNSVVTIGKYAFFNCTSLTVATLGEGVTSIGDAAFYDCSSLNKTNYIGDLSSWCKIKFSSNTANPIYYSHNLYINDQEITELVIPNDVDTISNYAFERCYALTSITIPNTIAHIETYAFDYCSFVKKDFVNNSSLDAEENNYWGALVGDALVNGLIISGSTIVSCQKDLTEAIIPDYITSIGWNAFDGCLALTKTNYTGDIAGWCNIEIGNYSPTYYSHNLFINNQEVTELIIPNTVEVIHPHAFEQCTSITSVVIPNSVKNIGNCAFEGCSSLVSLTIGDGCQNIGICAFDGCSSLVSLTIGDGCQSIGNFAFRGCSSLSSPTISKNITSIGVEAFAGCSSLSEISLPDGLTNIDWCAFQDCSSLNAIKIPESVTNIGFHAFLNTGIYNDESKWDGNFLCIDNCILEAKLFLLSEVVTVKDGVRLLSGSWHGEGDSQNIMHVVLPNSVTCISERAFSFTPSLISVNIPKNVTRIGNNTFRYSSLESIIMQSNTPPALDSTAFIDASQPICYIPRGSSAKYEASAWKNVVSTFVEYDESDLNIFYTSSDNKAITPYQETAFDAPILQNSYTDGQGIITFSRPITQLGFYAFRGRSTLTSITIPNTVTYIGYEAFAGCSSLTDITIGESVKTIDSYAFDGCSSLTNITSNAIEPPTLEYSAFRNYNATVYLPNSEAFKNYVNHATWSQFNLKCSMDSTKTFSIHVEQPGTLGYLILEAAEQWSNVFNLTITGTINDEDMKYFSKMKYLHELDLSGTNISNIHGCKGLIYLNKVILPESVTEIGVNAFDGCVQLSDINLSNITTIGKSAFCNSAITSLYLPKATTIGAYAFSSCSKLASINLPVATTIEDYTFRGCYSLSYIAFPLVTTIGEGAFRLYDDGVYGDMSENMKEIDLSNVTSLGKGAFYGVSTLEKVILSDELEVLSERCFYYCEGLKEINIPSALKAIGTEALYRTAIEDLTLPEGVTTIGSSIFGRNYDSSDLKTLTLPSTLRSIASDAFASCGNLTDVYLYRIIPPTTAMGFNEEITLHVPAISLLDYKLSDTWSHIDNIVPIDGDANPITNLLIDNSYSLLSTEGFASKVDFDLHAGAEFTIGNNATLNIGTFTQTIGTITSYDYDYIYDENGYETRIYYEGTQYNATFLNYANVTVEKTIVRLVPRSDCWNFFSLPFDVRIQDITIDAMGTGTQGTHQWVIREYSGANRALGNGDTWLNVPADGTLKAHQGYILYWVCEGGSSTSANNFYYYFNLPAANTTTAQQMFTKDNVIVPLTEYMAESEQNRNWNLVGNPYPSFFDIQHMDFNAPITTWNGYGYQAYSLLDDSYRLRPAEAFFVQAPQGTNAIVFNQEGRSLPNMVEITEDEYYNKNGYYAPQRKQIASSSTRQVYNFLISNADYTDKARLVLNESARTAYDMTCDAAKMMSSNASVPQIYVNNNGTRYAIDERPAGNGEYILGVHFGKADTYTLQLQSTCSDQQVLLIDTETNLSVDLSQTPYSFTANAGDNPSRFRITIKQGVTTDIPTQVVPSSQPYKTIENGQLIIVQPNGKKYSVGGIQL